MSLFVKKTSFISGTGTLAMLKCILTLASFLLTKYDFIINEMA